MNAAAVLTIMEKDNSFQYPVSSQNVTLPISDRPECEGQADKPKLYLFRNNMPRPRVSTPLNNVSKSTSSSKTMGNFSGNTTLFTSLNISAVERDYSRQSSIEDSNLLLNNNNVKGWSPKRPGVDKRLVETTCDPRLCPRVLVDVDLPIQRPSSSPGCGIRLTTASVVNSYLSSRMSPLPPGDKDFHPDTKRSDPSAEKRERRKKYREERSVRNQKQQQLDAYKAWVNSQLRKKVNSRLIDDLRLDLKDGTVLAELIEIVGGEKLSGVYAAPSNRDEMIDNVRAVLEFVARHKIRMHEMSATDIVDGNLKCIMRLILALAAHYKPASVKHSSYHHIKSPSRNPNVTGIAQDAAIALAEARRNAARAGHRYRRSRDSTIAERRYGHRYQDSSSEQFSDSDHSQSGASRSRRELRQLESASHSSSQSSGARLSPRCYNTPTKNSENLPRSKSLSIDHIHAKDSGAELEDAASVVDKTQYDELLQEYTELSLSMQETKTELVMLQEILLRGEDSSDAEDPTNELIRQLHLKDKCVMAMKHDIMKLQDEIAQQIHEKEKITAALKSEIKTLHDQMQIVGATGASLSARVASQDKRMAKLEGKIFQSNPEDGSHSIKPEYQSSATELHVVRDSLQSLRQHFENTSPHNHTIDTLEQSIALLIEKLHTTDASSLDRTLSSSLSPKKLNYDSAPERRSSSSITPSGFRMNRFSQGHTSQNGHTPPSTNVLYFTDTSVTPKTCTIQKKLGEIRLRDFKKLFDRPSMYRYHFKALDPEYGTVKEEVANDEDIVPGWEGKIVAWVEADLQTEC